MLRSHRSPYAPPRDRTRGRDGWCRGNLRPLDATHGQSEDSGRLGQNPLVGAAVIDVRRCRHRTPRSQRATSSTSQRNCLPTLHELCGYRGFLPAWARVSVCSLHPSSAAVSAVVKVVGRRGDKFPRLPPSGYRRYRHSDPTTNQRCPSDGQFNPLPLARAPRESGLTDNATARSTLGSPNTCRCLRSYRRR